MQKLQLSIIIVNYNVKYFLEQALYAVRKASKGLAVEVWVVDNNSVDDSVEMLRRQFPEVKLIANRKNVGFSVANNQAIAQARGEYVLLLNPDTVLREDSLSKPLAFLDARPQAGALGVRMIDGRGDFLPESKRGFPSPEVAFYKAFGLSKLFPKSKRFNHYHLGYLDEHKIHEVEVLSGAYMLLRRSVLEEIGYLDETFFMYGEDIDLSYRIVQAGYKNYYYPETTIIHYKGESTKKGSLNYVKTFYQAMIIFARKHFAQQGAWALIALLQMAIYFRATLSLLRAWSAALFLPICDALLLYGGLYMLSDMWSQYRYEVDDYFQQSAYWVNFPLYTGLWLSAIYLRGGYDKQARPEHLFGGLLTGSIAIAVLYGFLPLEYRSSRMLLVLGALWAFSSLNSWRWLLEKLGLGYYGYAKRMSSNLLIVGSIAESKRVQQLLYQAQVRSNFIGTVAASPQESEEEQSYMGHIEQLDEIISLFSIQEIVFCGRDLSSQAIIHWMSKLGPQIQYKILPEHSLSIIGSNSKDSAGDLYTVEVQFRIATAISQRYKRLFDILSALFALLLSPVLGFFLKEGNFLSLLKNSLSVLLGKKTWLGYHPADTKLQNLPALRPGILNPCDAKVLKPKQEDTLHRLHILYAKDYSWQEDFFIWRQNLSSLGRKKQARLFTEKKEPISEESY